MAQWSQNHFADQNTFSFFFFFWKSRSQTLKEKWRDTKSELLEVQCEVSTVGEDLRYHVICLCWSTVLYQIQSQGRRF